MQATDPLKFGAKIRIQVESDICTESGRPSPNCFHAPRRLAVSVLEQVCRCKNFQYQLSTQFAMVAFECNILQLLYVY